jgi:hypothetical protein
VAKSRYLGKTEINQNCDPGEVENRSNSEKADILSSRLLPKHPKIITYRTIIFLLFVRVLKFGLSRPDGKNID